MEKGYTDSKNFSLPKLSNFQKQLNKKLYKDLPYEKGMA
jgi:hypothetical protein